MLPKGGERKVKATPVVDGRKLMQEKLDPYAGILLPTRYAFGWSTEVG